MEDFMKCVNYRVTEGSAFTWRCWGDDAYRLDSWNGDQDGHTITITFDTKDQTTYCVEAFDYARNRAYRWMAPTHSDAYHSEALSRGVDPNEAWEDVKFVDLDVLEDFWAKATAIVAGQDYDTRVTVPLDIPDEDLLKFMLAAHERDMTFNEFVEQALREAIQDYQANHEYQIA
jgi:hypothetical protein